MFLDFNEYQSKTETTAVYPTDIPPIVASDEDTPSGYSSSGIVYPILGLVGESGEIAEKIKKIIRDKGGKIGAYDKLLLLQECGDVLWYLARIAAELGTDLETVARMNLEKLSSRKERGVIHGKYICHVCELPHDLGEWPHRDF